MEVRALSWREIRLLAEAMEKKRMDTSPKERDESERFRRNVSALVVGEKEGMPMVAIPRVVFDAMESKLRNGAR